MNNIIKKIKKEKWLFIIGLLGVLLIIISVLCNQQAKAAATATSTEATNPPTYYQAELTKILKEIDGVDDVEMMLTEKGAIIIVTGQGDAVLKEKITKATTCVLSLPSNKVFVEFN
jgi:CTP-dependent riboflavin kinase